MLVTWPVVKRKFAALQRVIVHTEGWCGVANNCKGVADKEKTGVAQGHHFSTVARYVSDACSFLSNHPNAVSMTLNSVYPYTSILEVTFTYTQVVSGQFYFCKYLAVFLSRL